MKVALGFSPYKGPWGGGNRFTIALSDALASAGHEADHSLEASDIDIIVLTDPRPRAPTVSFSSGAILRYLLLRNPRAIVIHRVNECDERKGSRGMNNALVRANYCADHTVFVGKWLTDLPVWRRNMRTPHSVIRNGADTELFHPADFIPWSGTPPLRLVTHHWGGNWMKGFDVYSRIDAMLDEPEWRNRITFTYIGNLPNGFKFKNATYIPAMDGNALAIELKQHHAYVTASLNEPGGNHQNEAALCGLPLLYRESGCLPEYCAGFGISYRGPEDITAAIERLSVEYTWLAGRMAEYPHTAARMASEWLSLFNDLLEQRESILARRELWRNPWLLFRNQLPK